MATVEDLTEQILYRLSLDPRARELAARLLERLHRLVGDLPASADHHHRAPGGLFQHSLAVAVKMLEEFEGHIIMERKADGSVDSFQSARNRPRWQYASFLAALCHDLGKVFDMEVRSGQQRWFSLQSTYQDFARRIKEPPSIVWREDREHGARAALSCLLLHHLLTADYFSWVRDLADPAVRFYERLYLAPFTLEETTEYVQAVFRSQPSKTRELAKWLYEKTLGHPYFLAFVSQQLLTLARGSPLESPARLLPKIFRQLEREKFSSDLAQLSPKEIELLEKGLLILTGRGRYKLYHPLFKLFLQGLKP